MQELDNAIIAMSGAPTIDETVTPISNPATVAAYLNMVAYKLKQIQGTLAHWYTAITGTPSGTTFLRGDGVWATPVASIENPGVIKMYGNATPPAGWLLCDGTQYATAAQPGLFAVIGYTYGGSGANFNVPDLRTRFPLGMSTGISALGDSEGFGYTIRTPAHIHATYDHTHTGPSHTHTGPSHVHAQNETVAVGEINLGVYIHAVGPTNELLYTAVAGGGTGSKHYMNSGVSAAGTGATGAGGTGNTGANGAGFTGNESIVYQVVAFIIKT